MVVGVSHAATAPHETRGNLIYTGHGLRPYWSISELLDGRFDDSKVETETTIDGEDWTLALTAQRGGIAPRPRDDGGDDRLPGYRLLAYEAKEILADGSWAEESPDLGYSLRSESVSAVRDRFRSRTADLLEKV